MSIQPRTDLKIEVAVPTAGLQNLVKNPDGDKGGYGWETPGVGSTMDGNAGGLTFVSGGVTAYNFYAELMPITAGKWAVGKMFVVGGTSSRFIRMHMNWYDANKTYLSASTYSGYMSFTAGTTLYMPAQQAPAGAAYFAWVMDFHQTNTGTVAPVGNIFQFKNAMAAVSNTNTGFGSIRENLYPDPSCLDMSLWNYTTPEGGSIVGVTSPSYVGSNSIGLNPPGTGWVTKADSVPMDVTAGEFYTASMYWTAAQSGSFDNSSAGIGVQWFVGGAWEQVYYSGTFSKASNTGWVRTSVTMQAPAGATKVRVIAQVRAVHPSNSHYFDAILVEQTNYVKDYFSGATTNGGGVTYSWAGTANQSKSTATVASGSFDYQPPLAWLDITGTSNHINTDREVMNLGTASVVIKGEELDPTGRYEAILKPGAAFRVRSRYNSFWGTVFTGKISNARVEYDKSKVLGELNTTVTITALDPMTDLANQTEPRSVSAVPELAYTLEGKGVPWNVNGYTGHYAANPTIPVTNENLTMADQVVITRDTTRGQAFIDKNGVLQVRDAATPIQWNGLYITDVPVNSAVNYMASMNPTFEENNTGPWTVVGCTKTKTTSASMTGTGSYGLRLTSTGTTSMSIDNAFDTPALVVPSAGLYAVSFYVRPSVAGSRVVELYSGVSYTMSNTSYGQFRAFIPSIEVNGVWRIYLNFQFYKDATTTAPVSGAYFDVDNFSTTAVAPTVDYSGIDVEWDSGDIVNQVLIKHLTIDAEGKAAEIDYGPYSDNASVEINGAKQATYKIVGNINAATYAANILAANATPQVRPNKVLIPVSDIKGLLFAYNADLGQLVYINFADKIGGYYRIASMKHDIGVKNGECAWYIELTFETSTSNALPQLTPTPPVKSQDLTDTGWVNLPLVNNWAHYDTITYGPARYRRKGGIVYITGLVAQPINGQGAFTICVLPPGFRPTRTILAMSWCNVGPQRLDIDAGGNITYQGGSTGPIAFGSMQVSYPAEQ